MAVSPNTTFVAGNIYTAAQANAFPRGIMGKAISTVNTSATTSYTDLTGMSITFTAVVDRLYRATFSGFCQQGSNSRVFVKLADAAGTQFDQSISGIATGGANIFTTITAVYLFTATGSITRKIQSTVDTGTATWFGATADVRSYSFTIEDIGGI